MARGLIIVTEKNYVNAAPTEDVGDEATADSVTAAFEAQLTARGWTASAVQYGGVGGYDRVRNCQKHYFWVEYT